MGWLGKIQVWKPLPGQALLLRVRLGLQAIETVQLMVSTSKLRAAAKLQHTYFEYLPSPFRKMMEHD